MDPALALPSYRVYRGSLLALLVGSIVAVWLLVLPPAGADQDGPPDSIARLVTTASPTPSPTAIATASSTGTPSPTSTADGTGTPGATEEPTATPTPTPTATPSEQTTYTVQAGDTLFAIAANLAQPGTDSAAFAQEIAAVNGITDAASLSIGQVLIIPAQ